MLIIERKEIQPQDSSGNSLCRGAFYTIFCDSVSDCLLVSVGTGESPRQGWRWMKLQRYICDWISYSVWSHVVRVCPDSWILWDSVRQDEVSNKLSHAATCCIVFLMSWDVCIHGTKSGLGDRLVFWAPPCCWCRRMWCFRVVGHSTWVWDVFK